MGCPAARWAENTRISIQADLKLVFHIDCQAVLRANRRPIQTSGPPVEVPIKAMPRTDLQISPDDAHVASSIHLAEETIPKIPKWKRILDVTCVLLAVPFLIPVGLVLAAFIKIVSPGPAFFRQKRVGCYGRPFMCLKFRTMKVNSDVTVHQAHLKELMTSNRPTRKLDCGGDSRLIRGGLLLRSLGVDELPQLFNVLWGEMSLVGTASLHPLRIWFAFSAAQTALRGAAGFDRSMAGQRQKSHYFRGNDQFGFALCPAQVGLDGLEDHGVDADLSDFGIGVGGN